MRNNVQYELQKLEDDVKREAELTLQIKIAKEQLDSQKQQIESRKERLAYLLMENGRVVENKTYHFIYNVRVYEFYARTSIDGTLEVRLLPVERQIVKL